MPSFFDFIPFAIPIFAYIVLLIAPAPVVPFVLPIATIITTSLTANLTDPSFQFINLSSYSIPESFTATSILDSNPAALRLANSTLPSLTSSDSFINYNGVVCPNDWVNHTGRRIVYYCVQCCPNIPGEVCEPYLDGCYIYNKINPYEKDLFYINSVLEEEYQKSLLNLEDEDDDYDYPNKENDHRPNKENDHYPIED